MKKLLRGYYLTEMQVAIIVYKASKTFPAITDHCRGILCRTKEAAISLSWRNVPDKLELFQGGLTQQWGISQSCCDCNLAMAGGAKDTRRYIT